MRSLCIVLAVLLVASVGFANEKEKPWGPPIQTSVRALDCTAAVPIGCGETLNGDNTGMPNNVVNYGCTTLNENGGEVVYVIEVSEGACQELTITVTPSGADLDIFFLGSCDEADCIAYSAGTSQEVIDTPCLEPGTYYIVVDGYGSTYPGAEGPYTINVECAPCDCPVPPCCPFDYVKHLVDFNVWNGGFTKLECNGNSVWQWMPLANPGVPSIACDDVPVTNILGTIVDGDYDNNAGEAAVLGPFTLDEYCTCMEICHFFDTEGSYDGGNVKISTDGGATWTVVTPSALYPYTALSSSNPCLAGEPGFSGHAFNTAFRQDCFDLTPYVGSDIMVGFFFGSDGSVGYYPGWYIKWLKIGSNNYSPVENKSWGTIKSMYE